MKNKLTPPSLPLQILVWFCPSALYEGIEGDLLEQYENDLNVSGEKKAKLRLYWNVLKFFRPGILFRRTSLFKFTKLFTFMDILASYLKIALRTMKHHKAITSVNMMGLAVCMSAGLMIIMIVKTSRSYDQFHPHAERTYRIITYDDESNIEGWSPVPLANEVANYPFVENSLTIITSANSEVVRADKVEIPVRTAFTENSFFKIFGFRLSSGDEATALINPYSSVITEEASKKIFGTSDPLGKVIEIGNWGSFTVTGVIAHHEEKSAIASEIFISKASLHPLILHQQVPHDLNHWNTNYESNTYVLLKTSNDRIAFQKALDKISERVVIKNKQTDTRVLIYFTALGLTEIPPAVTRNIGGIGFGMSIMDMITSGSFALLFVLLAIFNYTHLTAARVNEAALQKITIALRIRIAAQIFAESILVAVFASLVAFFVARFIPLSPLLKDRIDFTNLDVTLSLYFLVFALLVGFMAGLFPTIVLSKIKPLQAIRNLLKLFKIASRNLANAATVMK